MTRTTPLIWAEPRPRADDTQPGVKIVGTWYGGESYVDRGGAAIPAHVWFRFEADGRVCVSVRCDEERARTSVGRWTLVDGFLSLDLERSTVRAPIAFEAGGVMRWAGELLVRVPTVPRGRPEDSAHIYARLAGSMQTQLQR